ncbi:hypothetical protein RB628_38300 [Streptomyces sp. ADMS]|uniref:ABC transporter permease n=1 Tax=Streptomyces sp. ADMS TaxID=3071415 RepID=UPI00296F6DE8|nr:hypothetical protein [Streptomyces sp. ADMS]MDW4911016.1 hypothetical protein [Streptomyces sp. ADMS]
MNQPFLLLTTIRLVICAADIANATLVTVLERAGEIGLRRALGALGRLIGTTLGTLTVFVVALSPQRTRVIPPLIVALAPAIGLAAVLLASLCPAWRAARIQPAEVHRR